MRDRVVTVFGGSGFVGRYVVQRLAALGATVRVPARRPERALFLKPLGAVGQIVLEPWSPRAGDAELARHLVGSTHAVNLIGILHESRSGGGFDEIQGRLPGRIAAAAAAGGALGLLQVSAIGADPASASAYARTKAEGERRVREAFPDATILRPSIVIGPEDGFFNRFATLARMLPALPLIGGGQTRFQPVYVGDVARAVVAALQRDGCQGMTYELGGPRVYTFAELMRYMLQVLGRRRLLLDVPFGLATLQAGVLELLPQPLLTRDQVELLKQDNVVTPGMPGLEALGINPTPIELIVPQYLARHRATPARAGERPG
jgi:uncharacterized protein YbjT (DUF2867 family)